MKGEIKYVKPVGNCNIRSNRHYNINGGMFCNSNDNTGVNNHRGSDFSNSFDIHTNWFCD